MSTTELLSERWFIIVDAKFIPLNIRNIDTKTSLSRRISLLVKLELMWCYFTRFFVITLLIFLRILCKCMNLNSKYILVKLLIQANINNVIPTTSLIQKYCIVNSINLFNLHLEAIFFKYMHNILNGKFDIPTEMMLRIGNIAKF